KDLEVPERESVTAQIQASEGIQLLATANHDIIEKLARVSGFSFPEQWTLSPANTRAAASFTVGLDFEKQIDVAAERERLQKELAKYEKNFAAAKHRLSDQSFLSKAPTHIVEGLRKQESDTWLMIEKVRRALQ